jgi:hypothetical protein
MTQDRTQAQEEPTLQTLHQLTDEEQKAALCAALRPGTSNWVALGCGPANTPIPSKHFRGQPRT